MNKNGVTLDDLQQIYIDKEREIFNKINSNSTAIYWYQEERMSYHSHDILQFWGTSSKIATQLQNHPNNSFILSPIDYFYLD